MLRAHCSALAGLAPGLASPQRLRSVGDTSHVTRRQPVADNSTMGYEGDLHFIRGQLESLDLVRMQAPLSTADEHLYKALCQRERRICEAMTSVETSVPVEMS